MVNFAWRDLSDKLRGLVFALSRGDSSLEDHAALLLEGYGRSVALVLGGGALAAGAVARVAFYAHRGTFEEVLPQDQLALAALAALAGTATAVYGIACANG